MTVWGHKPLPSPHTFDLDKARELLIAAGYSDGWELTCAYDPGQDVHAELWQAALAEIGVTLHLERADYPAFDALIDDGNVLSGSDRQAAFPGGICCHQVKCGFRPSPPCAACAPTPH